ncbi:MAG: rhodanese-like domain-containing protein [Gemmatimonadota bacterium]
MRLAVAAITLLLATLPAPVASQPMSAPDPDGRFVVGTDWLAAHRRDRDLVLVHVVQDSAFAGEVIPGSRVVWYRSFVKANGTVSSELPSLDVLRSVVEKLGITNGSRVVVYANEAPMATRLLFTLDYLGHDRMSFLDGGLRKWKREGRPVTTEVIPAQPSRYTPTPREAVLASADWVHERLHKPGLSLLDTRTLGEYTGTGERGGLPSTGHLAGARQLEWEWMFSDADYSVLKPRAELEKLFAERIKPGDQVVAYCWVGYRGSATYFIARHLGYDVRLYDGSFQDWAQRKLPVRAGSTP